MPTRHYRLTVIGCALCWFLVGFHLPGVHQMLDHGRPVSWTVAAVVTLLGVAAVVALWRLLRSGAPATHPVEPGTPAS